MGRWAALDRLLACHSELPLLRSGHTPCTPARTKGTGTFGAQIPEGLVDSGFLGLRTPWVSPHYTSQDPAFKMVLRVQFPPLLPQASSPKVQHPSSPILRTQGPFVQCYVQLGIRAGPAPDQARVRRLGDPGPGMGMRGPGRQRGPDQQSSCTEGAQGTLEKMPPQPSRAGMARPGG